MNDEGDVDPDDIRRHLIEVEGWIPMDHENSPGEWSAAQVIPLPPDPLELDLDELVHEGLLARANAEWFMPRGYCLKIRASDITGKFFLSHIAKWEDH